MKPLPDNDLTNTPDLATRLALASEPVPAAIGGPSLLRLLAEAQVVMEPMRRLSRNLDIALADHPRKVMLLPGFGTHPIRMRYMAQQLERAGHRVKRWAWFQFRTDAGEF